MARESKVIVDLWCDFHLKDEGARVEAVVEETVQLGRLARTIAACAPCSTTRVNLATLREVLLDYGAKPDAEVLADGRPARVAAAALVDSACPVPGCPRGPHNPLRSRGSLSSHLRKKHGQSLAALGGKPRLQCPAKDCQETPVGLQGIAAHMRAAHPRVRRPAAGWPKVPATESPAAASG